MSLKQVYNNAFRYGIRPLLAASVLIALLGAIVAMEARRRGLFSAEAPLLAATMVLLPVSVAYEVIMPKMVRRDPLLFWLRIGVTVASIATYVLLHVMSRDLFEPEAVGFLTALSLAFGLGAALLCGLYVITSRETGEAATN